MKPLEYPLLADENIHPAVVHALRGRGVDIVTVADVGLLGNSDRAVLDRAHQDDRVVITHDSDFGTLVIRGGARFSGIIFLRPGHVDPSVVLSTIEAIARLDVEVLPPFILVAERREAEVRIRFRPALAPEPPGSGH